MTNVPIAPLMANAWKKVGLTIVSLAIISFSILSFLHKLTEHLIVYMALSILLGLLLLTQSREKNETEYVIKLRYNAYRITFSTLFLVLFIFSGRELLHQDKVDSTFLSAVVGLFTYLITFYVPLLTNGFGVYSETEAIEGVKKEPVVYVWLGLSLIGIIIFLCLSSSFA